MLSFIFRKVEFLISLSALSRLLHCFPQEEKHRTRECVIFPSFTHPCTLCQTRVIVWPRFFLLRGRKALLTNPDVSSLKRKADRASLVKRGSLNFTPQMRAHSPGLACVGNDCPYCRLLWSFPTRLCYASDSALQRLEYMRIHDPHVKVKMKLGPEKVSMCLFSLLVRHATARGGRELKQGMMRRAEGFRVRLKDK